MQFNKFIRLTPAWLIGLILVSLPTTLLAKPTYDPAQRPDVAAFIDTLVKEQGLSRPELEQLFAQTKQRQDILDLIAKPAERVLAWHEYRKIFLTPARIQAGQKFMHTYADALNRAEQTYGVPAEIITAIIGVETFYGRNKGRHRVIDALATLTFDYPPRVDFFKGQLVEFVRFTLTQGLNPQLPMGSYAGAMGYPQFMPSSYRDYAVDFDGDGFADIWTNPVDAIGSVANYFSGHGWQPNQPVVVPIAHLPNPGQLPELHSNRFNLMPLAQAQSAGLVAATNSVTATPLTADTQVLPMAFELEQGELQLLGLHNFYVITRYNHSRMYALAVYQLAEALRN